MKNLSLIVLLSVSLIRILSAAEPYDSLAAQVNAHWVGANNAAILQLAESRIENDSNDVFGLSLKCNYYLYAEINLSESRAAVDQLYTHIASLGNESLSQFVQGLKDQVYSIPLSESATPFTQAEKDAMRAIFDDAFPSIEICVSLASKAAELAQQ